MIRKVFLIIIFILLILPLWFLMVGSLLNIFGIFVMPPNFIPNPVFFGNYEWAFKLSGFIFFVKNTIIVCLSTVLCSVFISSTAGFCFSFYKYKLKTLLWSLFLIGIMLPRISMIIPLFVITRKIGIAGSLFAVILPVSLSPVGIYLAKKYFDTIPKSLIDASRIDGAGDFLIIRKIILPVSKPIIMTLSLFAAIGSLQDYIWQMLQLQKTKVQTLLVGLIRETMVGGVEEVEQIGHSFAVGIILLIPLLIIFLIANKYFISSLSGAIKE